MIYRDLREFIDHLDREGELLRIKEEINLEPDVGAIGEAVCQMKGPGILADNIAGYENARLSVCLHASWAREAMALGLPKNASSKEQKRAWLEAYERYPVPPRFVDKKNAPCKENVLKGDDINLFNFPIPRINTHDAAPYITKTMCITKDPESGWVNFGMYRVMVLDRNRTTIMTSNTSHWGQHYTKARRLGKPLEMAIVLGTDPVLPIVSASKIPGGWEEFAFAGAVRGEPVDLVKAETMDLPVPASAEIVLEGLVGLDCNVFEGPFGEFAAAYSSAMMMPPFDLTAVTHRNNPIFDGVHLGKSPSDQFYMIGMLKCANLERELKHSCPNITEIAYLQPTNFACVVQGKWVNKFEPRRAMTAVWSSEANSQSKMVIVVDEDIDPWNAEEVMWAIATRSQANTDIVMIPGTECRLDPSAEVDSSTCKFGIDATKSTEPHPRHRISEWIVPRDETPAWKEKILRAMKGGK